MEAIAGYESDVESTQTVDADDIQVNQVDLTGSQEYGEALPGTQEYDETVELAESLFHIVRPEDAFEYIRPVQPPENHQMLAMDLLNAFNAAPRQPAEEREAPLAIEDTVPAEGTLPDEGRNFRPLAHRMISRSRSRSTGRSEAPEVEVYVPQLDVENLPTRIHDPHRQCRLVPEGRPPKAIRGLLLDELATLIRRCGLEGAWRQGGKQPRAVFVGDGFIINQERSSTWAQGRRAQEIDARLRAARRSGQ